MSKMNDLIEFLRLGRRHDEAASKTTVVNQTKVSATAIDTNEERIIDRTDFNNSNIYKRIVGILDNFGSTHFYVLPLSNKRIFYIKLPATNSGNQYLNLEDNKSEHVADPSLLEPIEINEATNEYFYDMIRREVLHTSEILEETNVFLDIVFFNPEKINIESGSYEYKYSKPITPLYKVLNMLFDIFKYIISSIVSSFLLAFETNKNVEITVRKKGSIYLIPSILVVDEKTFCINYYYTSSGKKMFYQISDEDIAIKLRFDDKYAFLSYLNATIFSQDVFNYSDTGNSSRRFEFVENFQKYIIAPMERKILSGSGYSGDFREAMTTLYYLTDSVALSIDNNCLWRLFEEAIRIGNFANTQHQASENIFIKLLEFIAEKETSKIVFLNRFLQKTEKKITYLEFLYDKLDGDNNTQFVKFIHKIWKESIYRETDPDKNRFITAQSPVLLDYRSSKKLGFHVDNAAIDWNSDSELIEIAIDIKTGTTYEHTTYGLGQAPNTTTEETTVLHNYAYHPFAPIVILNADNPTFILKDKEQQGELFTILPAFVLLAREKKAFWENVVTAGEYAIDIATTLSGVGNILKVGRLAKLAEAGYTFTRTTAKVATGVKAFVGVVEVSSGAGNALIKLLDINDTDLGREIARYLFYLEMLSLSGELSVALHNGLKKSARLLTNSKNKVKIEKKLDELVESGKISSAEKEELIENLKKMADGGYNPNFSIINEKVRLYWTKYLTKKGVVIEIGTEEAKRMLNKRNADGLFIMRGYNSETNSFKERIIYLHEDPSTSAFLEETYHALQSLEGVQMYKDITYKGTLYENVDNWEFLAKKRILDEAQQNGISYEEYLLVEKQLDEVLKNKYY